ncbi:MAG: Asd/ArgC dimerization domain-containing protein [Candidatus Acidiferrales bacterium]
MAVRAHRFAIAGASSLLGEELKHMIEEGPFAAADLRLLDEDLLAGTLTEAGGEPAIIQRVEEDSFSRAEVVLLACSPGFAVQCYPAARAAGAVVIDLSGGLVGVENALPWIPRLDEWLPPPHIEKGDLYLCPSGGAIICCTLAAALSSVGAKRLIVNLFRPVSESGRLGVEELESQTAQLLSFQPLAQAIFDTQVAFTLLDRYGESSAQKLFEARRRIVEETQRHLGGRIPAPAVQLLHVPVFYGTGVSAFAEFGEDAAEGQMIESLRRAGVVCAEAGGPSPSNVSVAGESCMHLASPQRDEALRGGWWFWGVADNLRLPAANALAIAEKVL